MPLSHYPLTDLSVHPKHLVPHSDASLPAKRRVEHCHLEADQVSILDLSILLKYNANRLVFVHHAQLDVRRLSSEEAPGESDHREPSGCPGPEYWL